MKAEQNLEVLDQFETLIITSPSCYDTIIIGIKNGKLVIRNYYNEHATEETLNKHVEGLSTIHRNIKFTGKINILASDGLDKPMLFSIEETSSGLKIKPVERKQSKQYENLSTSQEHSTDINRIIESLNFEITTINSTIIQLSKVKTHDPYSYANVNNSIDNLKYTKKNLERIVKLLQNENLDENTLNK